MRFIATAVLLIGCNDVLGFGDPTLAAPDASTPACAAGWTYRVPIALSNESGGELDDYQIMLRVDTQTTIAAGKLQPTGNDLRFGTGFGSSLFGEKIESGLDTPATIVWIDVPVIPVGTSTVYLYYGNPAAEPWSVSPFVQGVILNPSFEDSGGWSTDTPVGPQANVGLPAPEWSTDGRTSFFIDEEVQGDRGGTSQSSIGQPIVLPIGTDYVIRFDINVIAASNSGVNDANNGGFLITIGDGLDKVWQLFGTHNITGVHLEQETLPFGAGSFQLAFAATVDGGSDPGYAKAYIDNLRLRKYASPEPTAQLGAEEACPP